jgi:hypothetical protein
MLERYDAGSRFGKEGNPHAAARENGLGQTRDRVLTYHRDMKNACIFAGIVFARSLLAD